MKFDKYLVESYKTEIPEEKAIDIIKTRCSDSLRGTPIYREVDSSKRITFVRPHGERPSRNTLNYYTQLFNHILPSWKKYPMRNVIASTKDYSRGRGRVARLFPYNDTKIGVCPTSDIWMAFQGNGIKYLDNGFNIPLEKLLIHTGVISPMDNVDKYPRALEKALMKADKKLREMWKEDREEFNKTLDTSNQPYWIRRFFEDIRGDKKRNFIQYLDHLLNPERNGFELKKIGDNIPMGREVWFYSEHISIFVQDFNNMRI